MKKDQDGIWIIDADGKTLYVNRRMTEILGTSANEMIGEHSFIYVFPEDASAAQGWFEAKRSGDASRFHFRLRRKDGSAVWVDVQGTPMYDRTGGFNGIVGTFSVSA